MWLFLCGEYHEEALPASALRSWRWVDSLSLRPSRWNKGIAGYKLPEALVALPSSQTLKALRAIYGSRLRARIRDEDGRYEPVGQRLTLALAAK